MNDITPNRSNLRAPSIAAVVAIILVTALTLIGELSAPVKDWLKATFYHHWLGKGYLATGSFLLVWLLLSKSRNDSTAEARAVRSLTLVGVASTLILLAFFWYEYLQK